MSAKRVLIFSFVYYPRFVGGAEIAVKEITDRIDPSDIEFHMIALRGDATLPREEKVGNVTVHRIGSTHMGLRFLKYAYPFLAARTAARLHAKTSFNAIWSIMANYSGFAALLFKLFHMNVPFVLTLQEGDPIEYILKKTRFVSRFWKMIFTHADRVQAISNYLAEFARSVGVKAPIVVVPNGVDITHFSQTYGKESIDSLRAELGFAPDDTVIVTTSRLVVKNAVGDIVAALAYLGDKVKLLVLGQGREEKKLKALVRTLGLEDRVRFIGYVSHAEMPKYLHASNIFVRPSLSEGFGNSFIEAMAASLPVVATPVGGIVDFLKNKQTGLFCDVDSPEDVARKIEIYIHDADLRAEIVDNAIHMVVDHYDWKIVAKDMKERVFDIL